MRNNSRWYALLSSLTLVIALIGCTSSNNTETTTTSGSAYTRLPSDDVEDIVTYADQVSVFSVIAEREIEPPPEVYERGEGYLGREITIRIEDTLWSRGVIANAEGDIDLKVQGWVMHENIRRPIQFNGAPRLELGNTYVGPLVWLTGDPFGDGEWVGYTSGANIQVINERTAEPDLATNPRFEDIAITLGGKSISELEQILNNTPPDRFSIQHADLDPESRWSAATRSKREANNKQ